MDVRKVDEDAEEELDKPGTTIGTKFSVLQIIRIPSLMRCGFHRKASRATILLACFRGLS